MRTIVLLSLLTMAGCETSYPVSFKCTDQGGEACPVLETCPEVPLGTDACGDLPGLFGHDPTPVKVGRPVGCSVGLSYGNPYYGDDQQVCVCGRTGANGMSSWQCGV
jgi:hypothetical protein